MTESLQPELDGQSILVTGGGTGIGAGIAACIARRGGFVTICGRTQSTLVATAESINDAVGRSAVRWSVADVTDESAVQRVVDDTVAWMDRLDGLVANAGGGGALAPLHLQDVRGFRRVVELNLVGTFLLAKHSVPHFARAGGGSFVAISSIAGALTHPFFGAYTAAKAGVEALVRNAADEYGPAGVRFNAVRPGLTATEGLAFVAPGTPVYQSYDDNTPLGGASEVAEVAELVSFLLSPRAARITGQVVNVDGGQSLRRGPDWSTMVVPSLGGLDVALGQVEPAQA